MFANLTEFKKSNSTNIKKINLIKAITIKTSQLVTTCGLLKKELYST